MEQIRVGIRDAKMHLSRFLRIVSSGGEVILTDRGRPVGRIIPFREEESPLLERLKRLEEKGVLLPKTGKRGVKVGPPVFVPGDAARTFLEEDRNAGK